MTYNTKSSRSTFLKKIAFAFVSLAGIGIMALKSKSSKRFINNYNLLSEEEKENKIKDISSRKDLSIKPMPPPYKREN